MDQCLIAHALFQIKTVDVVEPKIKQKAKEITKWSTIRQHMPNPGFRTRECHGTHAMSYVNQSSLAGLPKPEVILHQSSLAGLPKPAVIRHQSSISWTP